MKYFLILGFIFFIIEILISKNISYRETNDKYSPYVPGTIRIWELLLFIVINLIPVVNIIIFLIFIIFFIDGIIEKEIKINVNKNSKVIKFLNKEI